MEGSSLNPRILVVDDEAMVAHLLKDFFVQRGFEVDSAAEGREALEKVKMSRPDVIILDVMMPGMDGYTFLRELKKLGGNSIPIIVVTAREMMRDLFIEEGVKENRPPRPPVQPTMCAWLERSPGWQPGGHCRGQPVRIAIEPSR